MADEIAVEVPNTEEDGDEVDDASVELQLAQDPLADDDIGGMGLSLNEDEVEDDRPAPDDFDERDRFGLNSPKAPEELAQQKAEQHQLSAGDHENMGVETPMTQFRNVAGINSPKGDETGMNWAAANEKGGAADGTQASSDAVPSGLESLVTQVSRDDVQKQPLTKDTDSDVDDLTMGAPAHTESQTPPGGMCSCLFSCFFFCCGPPTHVQSDTQSATQQHVAQNQSQSKLKNQTNNSNATTKSETNHINNNGGGIDAQNTTAAAHNAGDYTAKGDNMDASGGSNAGSGGDKMSIELRNENGATAADEIVAAESDEDSDSDTEYIGKLLPDLDEEDRIGKKKCLVLDLDETLVHSSFKPVPNADFVIPVEIDGITHKVYVLKRPFVDEYLLRSSKDYEIVIFTASLAKYANPLLDQLDIHNVIKHRLFRESCVLHNGMAYVKDLSKLNRKLKNTIIVDNSAKSYLFHPTSAIPSDSWFDDMTCTQLLDILPFQETTLKNIKDVRWVLDAHNKSFRWLCNQANQPLDKYTPPHKRGKVKYRTQQ